MIAYRMVCGSNLSGIGKALLLYAGDNQEAYPMPGVGPLTPIYCASKNIPSYAGGFSGEGTATGAFQPQLPNTHGGRASIGSVFYMLVKYQDVSPKQFNCKGDSGAEVFKTSSVAGSSTQTDLTKLYDFGDNPGKFNSYAYHFPFARAATGAPVQSGFPVSVNSKPNAPLAADRSPAFDKNAASYINCDGSTQGGTLGSAATASSASSPFKDWSTNGNEYKDKDFVFNSASHQREGQNVLFNDGHVTFSSTANVGIDNDNIYQRALISGSFGLPTGTSAKRDREAGGYFPNGRPQTSGNYAQYVPSDPEDALLINEYNP
jgi:prepilin-type processing-associated H-X9-DG protein